MIGVVGGVAATTLGAVLAFTIYGVEFYEKTPLWLILLGLALLTVSVVFAGWATLNSILQ